MTPPDITSLTANERSFRSAILFDGALPMAKREERSSRLLQIVKRVTQLNSMHGSMSCPEPSQLGSMVYPLLAPALMEALHTSSFAEATRLVPGEADDFCASYAQDNPRSIIFTSDTDLLLYDYPSEVLVNFLKGGDTMPGPGLKVYSPSGICQQLQLKSLVQFAYAIHNDRWKSASENIREARNNQNTDSPLYLDFRKRYIDKVEAPPFFPHCDDSGSLHSSLQGLDARISEFVLQAMSIGHASTKELPLALTVFLPLFIEDPFRSSAWVNGREVRLLAYSLFAPSRVVVQEHARKAQGISAEELAIMSLEQRTLYATELLNTLSTSPIDLSLPSSRYWTLLAAQLALSITNPPHASLLVRVVSGRFDNTWAYVHLLATLQAVLYSLRLLKQCIAVSLALGNNPSGEGLPLDIVTQLKNALESLPSIANLFTVPGQSIKAPPEDVGLLDTLRNIYRRVGITDETCFEEPKSKKRRKREKREANARNKIRKDGPPATGSNIFAILESGG